MSPGAAVMERTRHRWGPSRRLQRMTVAEDGEEGCDLEAPDGSLASRTLELLARISPIPVPYAERYLAEHGNESLNDARDLIVEVKQYLALRVASGESLTPTRLIDEAWHALILQTPEYRQVCDALGMFVDHRTEVRPVVIACDRRRVLYEAIFGAMSGSFDEYPDCDSPGPDPYPACDSTSG
jgi:hypothetical protein